MLSTVGHAQVQAQAQGDIGWPREIDIPEGKVVICQPQADVLDGNILKGRGAISFTPKGKSVPGAAPRRKQDEGELSAQLV
jgi:hypothetical protein